MDINKFSPKNKLGIKSLLNLNLCQTEDVYEILHFTRLLKNKHYYKEQQSYLKNKTLALIMHSEAAYNRLSYKRAVMQAGGSSVSLNSSELSLGFYDLKDAAQAIKLYDVDGAVIATSKQSDIEEFSQYFKLPVINAASSDAMPCQILGDLFTVWEEKGKLKNIKIAYIGGNLAAAGSMLVGAVRCECRLSLCLQGGVRLSSAFYENAMQYGEFEECSDPSEAVKNADIVYTDNYVSVKDKNFTPFKADDALMRLALTDANFMHALPVRRELEVTQELADGEKSLIYRQTENRMHVQKAVLSLLLNQ